MAFTKHGRFGTFFISFQDPLTSSMKRVTAIGVTELLRKFLELTSILVLSAFSEEYCQKTLKFYFYCVRRGKIVVNH